MYVDILVENIRIFLASLWPIFIHSHLDAHLGLVSSKNSRARDVFYCNIL